MDAPRYCTHCAAPVTPGDTFCASCGARVTQPPPEPAPPKGGYRDPATGAWVRDEAAVADAKKQLKGTLPLTIVAIVVIILVVWSYIG